MHYLDPPPHIGSHSHERRDGRPCPRQRQSSGLGCHLGCVSNVVELPPLLKLTPLARSVLPSIASESPPLEIALVAGAATTDAIVKLNQRMLEATGIRDLARLDDDRRLVVPPLGNFETWTRVLSILTTESSIDHVTRAAPVETFGMPLPSSHRRRLDTASLVGVEKAQAHGI
ncbi:hypothetical protein Ae201684P_008791 [Aphanomyces euteiches]|uniref:Uncharacterized protein n=1 Tax=Aphanomyces euteiches TaxID=100861 RepID=A0A6G0XNY1_9STRA|nr:hypothetical protein Ae201684_002907 [Aphanomyces euteiches]KAH9093131.1 hypothetical protein Ae201684P_008791 [Aphanomyces euteiches]